MYKYLSYIKSITENLIRFDFSILFNFTKISLKDDFFSGEWVKGVQIKRKGNLSGLSMENVHLLQ